MLKSRWFMGVLALALVLAVGLPAEAQTRSSPVVIKKLDHRTLKTPDYRVQGVSGSGGPNMRTWARIELDYQTAKDWLDELEFTYYALLKNSTPSSGSEPYYLLTGTVTNIHIAKGRHESAMFIHPSVLERFGKVEAVAVIVKANGVVVGTENSPPSRTRWWEKYPPKGKLLNRLESAFAYHNYDNYEMIKPQTP